MIGPVLLTSDKGGVAKTSLVAHLAAVAADGLRVLVVDGDPRMSATTWLDVATPDRGLNDLLRVGEGDLDPPDPADLLPDLLVRAGREWPASVRVLPATRALANRNADATPGLTSRLQRGLTAVESDFDVVLLDSPGAVGGALLQALIVASRWIVVPTLLDSGGSSGVAGTLRTLKLMRPAAPQSELVGITVGMHDRRSTRDARFHLEALRGRYAAQLLPEACWPLRRVVSQQAQTARAPVTAFPAHLDVTGPVSDLLRRIAPSAV